MAKQVLSTRCIGMQPHYSGHVMAPMEYVFEVEEPAKRPLPVFLASLTLRLIFFFSPFWLAMVLLMRAGVLPS